MTPHLEEHPWRPIVKVLEETTGRRGLIHRFFDNDNLDREGFYAAIDDIAQGRVAVARNFLRKLIEEVKCQEMFGLNDETIVTDVPKQLPKHELRDVAAPLWSALIFRGLVEVPKVKFKEEMDKSSKE